MRMSEMETKINQVDKGGYRTGWWEKCHDK